MMPENDMKEQLSIAYTKAVCAHGGCLLTQLSDKDYGMDGLIRCIENTQAGFDDVAKIEVQLKGTADYEDIGQNIKYRLKNRNYDILANKNVSLQRILIVLCLPKEKDQWIAQDADKLIMKKCAYWHYVRGLAQVGKPNSKTTIEISKAHRFTVENLTKMMDRIKKGKDLNGL